MIDRLKKQIRIWERDGKHAWITRISNYVWIQARNVYDRLHIGSIRNVLDRNEFPTDPAEAVHMVCEGESGRGVRPMQVRQELEALIRLIAERKPRRVIEIGTARGGTLLLLCRFSAPDAKLVSIDLPYARNGGGYPIWKSEIYQSFAQSAQELHLLRANSHDPATVETARNIFSGEPVDFVFIDADHSYEGVRQDFFSYLPLVASDGIIAFHDILPNPDDPSIDVNEFWQELENDAERMTGTIVHDRNQGHSGIGVVRL